MPTGTGTIHLTTAGVASSQNFDTLSNTAGSTTNTTLPTGWYITETGGGARDNEQYAVDTGGSTTGDIYSYGAAAATDRALGALRSGTLIPVFGAGFTNDTGAAITSLDISFFGEEWRLGTAARTDKLDFQISFNATGIDDGAATWVDIDSLDFVTPDTVTVGAKNGNAAADRTSIAAVIASLNIPAGATFYIRWIDPDATGADDGLAIDDFSITAHNAAPAAETQSVAFNAVNVIHNEGNSGSTAYVFTVVRTGGTTGQVDFSGTVNAGSTNGTDFAGGTAPTTFSGSIPAGQASVTVTINVAGDFVIENDEGFDLTLTTVSNTDATVSVGIGAQATSTGVITNDDAPGTISVDDATVTEGDAGTTAGAFTVHRTGGATGTVTVDYVITLPGGAGHADGSDVSGPLTGTVTFNEGETTATIPFSVNGDVTNEPNETFTVALSNPTGGATIGDGSATATITNDDAPPTVSIGDATVVEGNGGVSYLVFTVSLSKTSVDTVTVNYATSDGTAVQGSDYLSLAGQVSFAAGETSKTVSIPVIGDKVAELNETVNVILSSPTNATINDGAAVGTITNDDDVNYFSLASGTFSENWTDTGRITVNDDWSKVASIRGYLGDIDPAGAVTGLDPRTLTGANNGAIDVIANLTATTSTSGGVGEFQLADPTIGLQGSGTADAPSIVLFLDASGRTDIHLTANIRDIDTTADNAVQQVAVQYRTDPNGEWTNAPGGYIADATTGGSATQVTSLDITLPPDANNAPTLQVRILTTNAAGNDEWVGIDDIVVTSAQAATPSYAIHDAVAFEGTTVGVPTPIAFTVTRTGDASQAGDVDYTITFPGGGFSADASDLTSELTGSVHFNAGETSATITLGMVSDLTPEADEAFTVTLSNPSSGTITHASATGTIVNDDGAPPFVSVSDVTQVEGDAGDTIFTFTVSRTGGTGAFSVDYATADGTATAGSDYDLQNGTLNFAAGENSKTVSITVHGDLVGETSETFSVNLSNPTGFAVLADPAGTGTILNDDVIPIYEIQGSGHTSPLDGQGVKTQGIVTAIAANGYYIQDPTGDGNDQTSDGVFVFTSTAPTGVAVGDLVQVTGTVKEFVAGTGALSVTEINTPTAIVLSSGNPLPAAALIGVGGRLPPSENGPGSTFNNALDFYESMEGMRVTVQAPKVVADTNSFGETWVVASGGAGATGVNGRGGITIGGGDLNPERIQIDDDSTMFAGYSPNHTTGDILSDVTGILNYSHTSYELLVTQAVTTTTDVTLGQETTTLAGDLNHLTVASYNIENADITDGQGKFDILAHNIVYNLAAPDIIGLQEIQDADGPGNGSDLSGQVTANLLINAIKAIGGPNYVYIEIAPTTPGSTGGEPGGNIRPGFLYNADRVTYVDNSAHILTDPAFNGSRKPLIADFLFNGQKIELIDVHFTSRLGSSELEGLPQPPVDAGDSSRTAMGVAVHNYIAGVLAADPALKLGVVGDFNGFYFEGGVGAIEDGGVLTDLHRTLSPEERYSYVFDGNSQAIDHIIVTQNLASGAQFDAVHLNAEFPNNSTRPTDHDPVVARFSFPNTDPQLDLDPQAQGTGTSNGVVEQDPTATLIAQNATVADADSPDFAGGTLTVTISANGQTGDVLSIANTAAITVSNGTIFDNGTEIATVAGGGDATTPLVVTFEASANAAAVQDVVRAIAFAHTSDAPSSAVRTVHYALTDGDGGSAAADATVSVQPVNDAPQLTAPTDAAVTFTENDPAVAILQGVTMSDPDLPASFTGGSLTLDVAGTSGGLNLRAGSKFVINDNGDGTFTLADTFTGSPVAFGTIAGFGTTHLTVTALTGAASQARVNDLIDDFTFVKAGDAVQTADATITVTFDDGRNTGSGLDTALTAQQTQILHVVGVNDAPGVAFGSGLAATEQVAQSLKGAIVITDADAGSGTIYADVLVDYGIFNPDPGTSGVIIAGGGSSGIRVTGTLAQLKAFFETDPTSSLGYLADTDSPPASATLSVTVNDEGNSGGGAALETGPVSTTITITAVDDPAVAKDDAVATPEDTVKTGSVFADNSHGADSDPDGPPLQVSAVNGDAGKVGVPITLASGALLTLNANGTYSYDPNGAFNTLTSPSGGETGAVNTSATDSFTYTLANGNTATVTVTVNGVAGPGDRLMGDGGDNHVTGTPGADFFMLQQGGADTAAGGEGADAFYFGAAFTGADKVDGGGGKDVVALQGDYSGGVTLAPDSLTGVETLSLLTHSDTRFGGGSASGFSYDLTMDDGNVAAGQQLIVNASTLEAGENLTFDGSGETDGSFFIYAGKGDDDLTGGANADVFFFAEDGRWGANDQVHGGGGNDILVLRGDYTVTFDGTNLQGVETVTLLSGRDARFYAAGTPFHYDITVEDSLLAAGQTMTFNGGSLGPSETLSFSGSAETGGSFRVFGGAGDDTIFGGGGNDLIFGGLGSDFMGGGAGHDTFRYQDAGESTADYQDTIADFTLGDVIDLSRIDADTHLAGDQAFSFIGSNDFSGHAGELRVSDAGDGFWFVQGDVDGDGVADLQIQLYVADSDTHPITAADFNF